MDTEARTRPHFTPHMVELDPNGRVTLCGSAAAEALGFADGGLTGSRFATIFRAGSDESVAELAKGEGDNLCAYPRADHSKVRAVCLTRVGKRSFLVSDVSALGSEALALERFFEASVDLVCIAGMHGYYTRVSPSFTRVLGWSEEHMLSHPIHTFVHPDDVDRTIEQFDVLAEAGRSEGFANRYLTKDGSIVWLQWASAYDSESGVICAIARDVTEQRRVAHELEAARKSAELASAAKSRFLAAMSHELRTPLNAIIGYSEMLLEDAEPNEGPLRNDLGHIREAGMHLLSLINSILDLSKIEAGHMDLFFEHVAVQTVVEGVADTVRPMVARNGNTLFVRCAEPGHVQTDRQKLVQILLNLLSNASKFTHDGEVILEVTGESDAVLFVVRDTGRGMDPSVLERVLEPFEQAGESQTSAYPGTGLGLSLAVRFAEMLGIRMTCESLPGEGTTFRLRVPRLSEHSGRRRVDGDVLSASREAFRLPQRAAEE